LIVAQAVRASPRWRRAGLIPRLTTPGVVSSIDVWRAARMKPSEGQAAPLLALALALFAENALPELRQGDFPKRGLARRPFRSRRRGGRATGDACARTRGAAAQQERHTDRSLRPALVLLVDQFEELLRKV